jgi:hypothetical protein
MDLVKNMHVSDKSPDMRKWLLLSLVGLLSACTQGTPFAPIFFEADNSTTIRIGLLPCGGGLSKISSIRVARIKDGETGESLLTASYPNPTRSIDLRIDDLRQKVNLKTDVRVVVTLSNGGEVSMPLRMSDLSEVPVIKVHDRNIKPPEFGDPKSWCDGVTSIP